MSSKGLDDHQSNGVHFFKVILETTLRDGELRVPRSFMRRHWEGISNPVILRLPNRTLWKVYWMKRDGDVSFRNGWKEFAEYLSLDVAQFLVFRYEGNSSFNVIVFGKNSLETKYPSSNEEGEEVDESDCSLKILDHRSPLEGKRKKHSSPSSHASKKIKTNPRERHTGSSKDLRERIKNFHEKVKNNFRSENYFFICTIQQSYTYRDLLTIPKEFCKRHLRKVKEQEKATLFVDKEKRTWVVDLKLNFNGPSSFTSGWMKFYSDNNLKFGDVCVFELKKGEGVSFKVVIFSLEKDWSTLFEDPEDAFPKANGRLISKNNEFNLRIKLPLNIAILPIDYIRNYYFAENGKFATLRVGESSWSVKLLYYDSNSSAKFSVGWLDFVRDCNLEVGDSCLFKMIDEEDFVFEVTISRCNH